MKINIDKKKYKAYNLVTTQNHRRLYFKKLKANVLRGQKTEGFQFFDPNLIQERS